MRSRSKSPLLYIDKSGHSEVVTGYKQTNAKNSNRSAALKECPGVNKLNKSYKLNYYILNY